MAFISPKATTLRPEKPVHLLGINEYMTRQNAADLITNKFPRFKTIYNIYNTYQNITLAITSHNSDLLMSAICNYQTAKIEIDITISTLRKNLKAAINSVKYEFSNSSFEEINRKIKVLKRSYYGFTN